MLLLRLVIKMSASPYRLLTHFGSVIQRFGSRYFSSLNSFGFTMVQRGESGVGFLGSLAR